MRLFAGDHFPRLAVQSGDLPRPWVMPLGLPRGHRDRLAALLVQALRALEPGLTMIELRWAERRFLTSGRLALPSSVLVWWRVNAIPVVDPQAVVLEGSRLTPGLALYDFDPPGALAAEAWLSPLKMGVLHRIQDRLFDHRPVAAHEEIADAIRELAAKLISPIDVVDAAEAMVEVEAQGEGLEAATAEAVGRVIAGRFATGSADAAVRALVAVGQGEELGVEGLEVLRKAGLADAGGPMPLMDLLRDEAILRRAVQRIVARRSLSGSLTELAPGLFPEAWAPPDLMRVDIAPLQAPARVGVTPLAAPKPRAAVVREALDHANRSDMEGVSRILLRAIQQREDHVWEEGDLALAGWLLLWAGASEDEQRGESLDGAKLTRIATIYEAAGDLLERADAALRAIDALCYAAQIRNLLYEWPAAEALYDRGLALARVAGDKSALAACLQGRADMRARMDRLQEALVDAEEAVRLFKELRLRFEEASALKSVGEICTQLGELDRARAEYDAALAAYKELQSPIGEGDTLTSLGGLLTIKGDLRAAREAFEQALSLFREPGLRLSEAHVHQMLGELSLQRQEPLRAREAYEEAARLYHELGDRRGEATALECLGDTSASVVELSLAREAYEAALLLARELGVPAWEAALLFKRAGVSLRSGDLDGAFRDCEESRRLYEMIGDRTAEARVLVRMGTIEDRRNRWDVSRQLYESAVSRFRESGDPDGLVRALTGLGGMLTRAERYGEAKQVATEALDVARATGIEQRIAQVTRLLKRIEAALQRDTPSGITAR